jgi:hypothetical protein
MMKTSSFKVRKLPDGQISKFLSSPHAKNISLNPSGKSPLKIRPSRPQEGRLAIVTDVGRDAVDAAASARNRCCRAVLRDRERSTGAQTNDVVADGEVVWS